MRRSIKRLDRWKEATQGAQLMGFHMASLHHGDCALLRIVGENWDELQDAFGEEVWLQVFGRPGPSLYYWDRLCPYIETNQNAVEMCLQYLRTLPPRDNNPLYELPSFLARVGPHSALLKEYCLRFMGEDNGSYAGWWLATLASDVLVEHFGGDTEVGDHLEESVADKGRRGPCLCALADGWPERNTAQRAFAEPDSWPLREPYGVKLACAYAASEPLARDIQAWLGNSRTHNDLLWHGIIRSLLRRLREDADLGAILRDRLLSASVTASEKASYPRILASARGLEGALQDWCKEELERQLRGSSVSQMGFDVLSGTVRAVAHSMLDALGMGR